MNELYEDSYRKQFSFGKNWKDFLNKLTDERIDEAIKSLKFFLGKDSLEGLSFVDIGCGSGLFSLSAKKLGVKKLISMDVDDSSVECARYLKNKYYSNSKSWEIFKGSALDKDFIASLGKFDIVYSWGVLHHTGDMWRAIKNVELLLNENSVLYLALYNEKTGIQSSRFWEKVKKIYSKGNIFIKKIIEFLYIIQFFIKGFIKLENRLNYIKNYKSKRGMNWWNDVKDWLGGYPYEYAKVKVVCDYFENKGYKVLKTKDCKNGTGCNEFLIKKSSK